MKNLTYMFILAFAVAITGPAFAGDASKATTEAECTKAGGSWDADGKKCSEKM